MNVSCSITLGPDDTEITPHDAAEEILSALGGDPAKDMCTVSIMSVGQAGGPPPPPVQPVEPPQVNPT